MIKKFGFIYLVTWLSKILGVFSLLLYAKYLTPEMLGIATVVVLVASFTEVFTQSGTVNYILAKVSLTKDDINTCFTINLILRFSASILLIIGSNYLSLLLKLNIQNEIIFIAIFIAFRGFENIYVTVQKRGGDFKTSSLITLITRILSFIVTSLGVIILQNHWPILYGLGLYHLCFVILSYCFNKNIPQLSLINFIEQFNFSKWIMLKGYFGFFRSKIDDFFVATNFSAEQIGSFGLAKEISMLKYEQITQPLLEPLLNSYRNNVDRTVVFFKYYILISISVLPICFFTSNHSEEIVLFFLGPKWKATADYIDYLVYLSYTTSIASLYATACNASLESKKILNADIFTFLISFFLLYVFFVQLDYNIGLVRLAAGVCTLLYFIFYFSNFVEAKKLDSFFLLVFIFILCFISDKAINLFDLNVIISSLLFFITFIFLFLLAYVCFRNKRLFCKFDFSSAFFNLELETLSFFKRRNS